MQHRHLKTFLAVAQSLNITRAAERIHLAQSSVTEQIQALETELDVRLFNRNKRQLRLTEAGERFRQYAQDLLALADEARASLAELAASVSGTLVIGGLETLCAKWIPSLLASFRQAHPAVGYELKVANTGELRQEIARGAMDVAFGFGEPPDTPELVGEVVGYDNLVVIAPPGHRLRNKTCVTTDDLATEPFLVTGQGCVYRAMFERTFSTRRPNVVGEFGSLASIRTLVASGVGCAMVPHTVVADSAHDSLRLSWTEGAAVVPIYMLRQRRRMPPPLLERFMDAARRRLT